MALSTSSLPYFSTIRSSSDKDTSCDRPTAARGDEAAATKSKAADRGPRRHTPSNADN